MEHTPHRRLGSENKHAGVQLNGDMQQEAAHSSAITGQQAHSREGEVGGGPASRATNTVG